MGWIAALSTKPAIFSRCESSPQGAVTRHPHNGRCLRRPVRRAEFSKPQSTICAESSPAGISAPWGGYCRAPREGSADRTRPPAIRANRPHQWVPCPALGLLNLNALLRKIPPPTRNRSSPTRKIISNSIDGPEIHLLALAEGGRGKADRVPVQASAGRVLRISPLLKEQCSRYQSVAMPPEESGRHQDPSALGDRLPGLPDQDPLEIDGLAPSNPLHLAAVDPDRLPPDLVDPILGSVTAGSKNEGAGQGADCGNRACEIHSGSPQCFGDSRERPFIQGISHPG